MAGRKLKFPYGNNDFYQLLTEDYCYIDRTDRIAQLEEVGKTLLFLRPRRYGKSLLLSTLENYYDIAKADEFERLFGGLAIGAAPTPLHNQYLILRWDFSVIAPKPNYQQQQQVVIDYLNAEIKAFALKYQDLLVSPIEINPTNVTASFWSLLSVVQQANHKVYLLIDEYDNFANELLMVERPQSQERYEALVFGEGEFKAVFKAIKAAMSGRGLDRTFIVGVSPVVLHDVSSGFNVAENIYFREDFNDLCGFTEAEVTQLLERVTENCGFSPEQTAEALHLMRTFYNGALFSHEGGECVYNPTSTFHFLKYLQRTCRYPRNMLDTNLGTDHQKLAYVAGLPKGEEVILQIMDMEHPPAVVALEERFGVHEMLAESNTEPFMLSQLYYLGVLTLDGDLTTDGELMLRIPNLVMQQLYAERLLRMLLPDATQRDVGQAAAKALYSQGQIQPLCDFIEQYIFPVFDNRDYIQANELTIKTAFLTLLFNDTFYIMDSEMALERTYADLTMILRPEMRRYQLLDLLLEFKFVKLNKVGLSGEEVHTKTDEELCALDAVKTEVAKAKQQLQQYATVLQAKYGEKLRLRTFSVVAIGFERLVWEEIKGAN